MSSLARVRPHPTDQQAVILDTPYELNSAMAKFGPAMMAKEHKGFVMLAEHLPSFHRFAETIDLQVIDERAKPPGEKTLMPECEHCAQPAALLRQPNRCPSCGRSWVAAFIGSENPHNPLQKACVRCGHRQIRSFHYCSQCGEVMPPDPVAKERHILPKREVLDEPMPLGQAIAEVQDVLLPEEDA